MALGRTSVLLVIAEYEGFRNETATDSIIATSDWEYATKSIRELILP